MRLGQLIHGLDVRLHDCGCADPLLVRVCDITEDSRTVVPGSLFIARSGLKADGKTFVADAAEAGAVAVVTDDPELRGPAGHALPVVHAADIAGVCAVMGERFYGEPAKKLSLIGVTGTNGKTTTTWLAWQMLNGRGLRAGLVGTVVIDDGVEVARAAMTTPPSLELSRTLSRMVESGCGAAALEVSSHSLVQKRCDALPFRVGVFTNLTGDHLDYHKTMEAYADAKARLFALLAPEGLAVVNEDDPAWERMVRGCRARVLRTGASARSGGAWVEVVHESLAGMELRLHGPWGTAAGRTALIGRYNAMNVLHAACACHELGMNAEALSGALARLSPPPGRLERITDPEASFHVFVDYAHSDDALRNVLTAVGSLIPGRDAAEPIARAAGAPVPAGGHGELIAVFGCGGDRDRTKRPRMGLAAATLADRVYVTSDNPRTERPSEIVDQILSGIPAELRRKVVVQVDRERAIRAAIESSRPGDVVVIAGKGHETEQILPDGPGATRTIHFDDREVARAVLGIEEPRAKRRTESPPRPKAARAGGGRA